jgi:hypothetical protein
MSTTDNYSPAVPPQPPTPPLLPASPGRRRWSRRRIVIVSAVAALAAVGVGGGIAAGGGTSVSSVTAGHGHTAVSPLQQMQEWAASVLPIINQTGTDLEAADPEDPASLTAVQADLAKLQAGPQPPDPQMAVHWRGFLTATSAAVTALAAGDPFGALEHIGDAEREINAVQARAEELGGTFGS